jgi:hypothetical protein
MLNGSKQGYGLPDTIDNKPVRAGAHGAIPSASKISAVTASPQFASSDARTEPFDHLLHAREARLTAYLSSVPSLLAYLDWAAPAPPTRRNTEDRGLGYRYRHSRAESSSIFGEYHQLGNAASPV